MADYSTKFCFIQAWWATFLPCFQTKQQQYCFHSRYGCYYGWSWGLGSSLCFAQRLEQRNSYRCLSHEPMRCQSTELPSKAPGLAIVSFGWEPACYWAHSNCLRAKNDSVTNKVLVPGAPVSSLISIFFFFFFATLNRFQRKIPSFYIIIKISV